MPSVSELIAVATVIAAASPAYAEAPFEPPAICRAAIAAIMDRDPKLVQTKATADGIVALTYARPFDNFVFAYRCRLDGERVVWASESGRWRDGPKDDKVYFEIIGAGAQLRIIDNHVNGSITKQIFDRSMIE